MPLNEAERRLIDQMVDKKIATMPQVIRTLRDSDMRKKLGLSSDIDYVTGYLTGYLTAATVASFFSADRPDFNDALVAEIGEVINKRSSEIRSAALNTADAQ